MDGKVIEKIFTLNAKLCLVLDKDYDLIVKVKLNPTSFKTIQRINSSTKLLELYFCTT